MCVCVCVCVCVIVCELRSRGRVEGVRRGERNTWPQSHVAFLACTLAQHAGQTFTRLDIATNCREQVATPKRMNSR